MKKEIKIVNVEDLSEIKFSRKEISDTDILIKGLDIFQRNLNNTHAEKVCKENIDLSKRALVNVRFFHYIPELEELNNVTTLKDYISKYYRDYGYETKLAKMLKDLYKQLVLLLKQLRKEKVYPKPKYESKLSEVVEFKPNKFYQECYSKYKNVILNKINKGLSPAVSEDELSFSPKNTDRGEIERMAFDDVKRWSTTGVDYNESRGDLRWLFGTTPKLTLADEKMTEAILHLREKEELEHLKALGIKEEEELSNNWLIKRITERMKKDRL